MACRSDGRLLQPSAPARAIDASFALRGAGPQPRVQNVHAVMATHSVLPGTHGAAKWTHVLTIGLNESFALKPQHLGDDVGTGPALAWRGYQPADSVGRRAPNVTLLGSFSAAKPLLLPACAYSDFGLHHIAPIQPASKLTFLGELGKWVPTAAARVTSVKNAADGLSVAIVGVASEAVELAFVAADGVTVLHTVCTLGATGTATAHCDGRTVTCT